MAGRKVTFDVLALAKAVGFDEAGRKIKKFAQDSKTHIGWLTTAIAAIGPAAIPLAAGAGAALAGLAPAAGVALLAFKGIAAEMKSGSILGLAYTKAFKPVVDEYHALSYLAADVMFTHINSAIQQSKGLFPSLASDVSVLAGQLGQIISNIVPGLLSFFHDLQPLIAQVGAQLVLGSAKFKDWAASGVGVQGFLHYAQANLPRVEHLLAQLAIAAVHLVEGIAPLGGVSFSTIGVFLKLVNAIPVSVLQQIAPIITGIVIATKTWEITSKALNIVLEANPFVRIATLILAIGTALVIAYQHSQTFRNVVQRVFIDVGEVAVHAMASIYHGFVSPFLTAIAAILGALGHLPFGMGKPFAAAAKQVRGFRDNIGNMIDAAQRKMDSLKARVDISSARNNVARLKAYVNGLQNKTISVTTYLDYVTRYFNLGKMSVTHDSHRAAGGPVYAGQPYIVGERRPELFVPSTNGQIVPRVPSGLGGGAAPMVLRIDSAGSRLDDLLLEVIRAAVRRGGGDVQRVLGR